MELIRTYKYRLYPNNSQIQILDRTLDICRYLYNCGLQERRDAYQKNGVSINCNHQQKGLPECKQNNEDLNLVYSQVLQDVLRRLDKSFKNFFRRIKHHEVPGYPRFKPKERYNSFTYPQKGFKISHGRLELHKIGNIKIRLHRQLEGKVKTLTIKRSATNKWYASFIVEKEKDIVKRDTKRFIGIDMGLSSFLTTSESEKVDNPRYLTASQLKLATAQKRLSSKKKESSNRIKQKQRVATIHEKIVNQRIDFQHKLSRKLVDKYDLIACEDLKIKNMVKNPFLSKSISDVSWSSFLNMLSYKAEEAGSVVVKVNPKNTSQVCSQCGNIVPKKLNQRIHSCNCGLTINRDVNAARNILRLGEGIAEFKLVENLIMGSVKQEYPLALSRG